MFAYPKYPLKEVQKPMNHVYQKNLMYINVVWSSLNELQKWIHNLIVTNIFGNDHKSIHPLMVPKLALQIND
jgi:hypothetical protein